MVIHPENVKLFVFCGVDYVKINIFAIETKEIDYGKIA